MRAYDVDPNDVKEQIMDKVNVLGKYCPNIQQCMACKNTCSILVKNQLKPKEGLDRDSFL